MPRKSKANTMRANHAVAIAGDEDQQRALRQIAFGKEWDSFEDNIEGRIAHFEDQDSVKQSTRRALGMIREMMFEKI